PDNQRGVEADAEAERQDLLREIRIVPVQKEVWVVPPHSQPDIAPDEVSASHDRPAIVPAAADAAAEGPLRLLGAWVDGIEGDGGQIRPAGQKRGCRAEGAGLRPGVVIKDEDEIRGCQSDRAVESLNAE